MTYANTKCEKCGTETECTCEDGGYPLCDKCQKLTAEHGHYWTEISSYTDSDGQSHTSTTYHPEEFHILCIETGGDQTFDCSESRSKYYSITNEQAVTVCARQGKWTGTFYLPSIQ